MQSSVRVTQHLPNPSEKRQPCEYSHGVQVQAAHMKSLSVQLERHASLAPVNAHFWLRHWRLHTHSTDFRLFRVLCWISDDSILFRRCLQQSYSVVPRYTNGHEVS